MKRNETETKTLKEILSFLTQFTMEYHEGIQKVKRTSKSELRRQGSITQVGLRGCEIFSAKAEAEGAGHNRVVEALKQREGQTPPNGVQTFYTLEETVCYVLECTMATLEGIRLASRPSKRELRQLESAVQKALTACRALNLGDVAQKSRCPRVTQALKGEIAQE